MGTLDRYIVRQFLTNYAVLVLVLVGLVVLVDMLAGLDEFVQAGLQWAPHMYGFGPAFLWSMADYYGPVVLHLAILLTGLACVGAAGFTLSAMVRQGELVAVVSSGVSLLRIGAPVAAIGAALNLASLPLQEYVIPPLAGRLVRDKAEMKKLTPDTFQIRYARDSAGNLLSAAHFRPDPPPAVLDSVTILQRDARGRAQWRIRAAQAIWEPDHRAWRLINGHAIHPLGADHAAADLPDPQPVQWFPTDLNPQVLLARRVSAYPRLISLADLLGLAHNPAADQASLLHILHTRFSSIVVNILILLISMVFFLVRHPTNLVLATVKAAAVTLSAWLVALVLSFYLVPGLNPAASAWLPVVILLPFTAVMLQTVKS